MDLAETQNTQNDCINHFLKAQELIYKYDFSNAEIHMNLYREKINYELFEKYDGRKLKNPLLSIVVVAYKTNNLLLECLSSLSEQSEKSFEIIIVDNGKNENVEEKLKEMQVLYIKCPINFILSEGRNIGVHFAKSEIVAFLDDDAVAPKDYTENILKAFKIKDVYAIRGKVLPKDSNFKIPESYDLGNEVVPSNITAEGNSAYLKNDFLDIGGMHPLLFGHEGLDFSYRMFKKYNKIKTFYFPDVLIYHNPAEESKHKIKSSRYELMDKFLEWLDPEIWYFNGVVDSVRIKKQKDVVNPQTKITDKSSVQKEFHGTEYGGWFISPVNLNKDSIVYSFGAGEDISFDLSLIEKFGLSVYVFDPTPKSIAFINKQNLPEKFNFKEYGIADFDGNIKFYPPENPNHVSHTILHRSATSDKYIEVPVKKLGTICRELGHDKIDLLKMDIEGAEYSVIEDIVKSGIQIDQLLVEFHDRFETVDTSNNHKAISQLLDLGYEIFSISQTGEEYSFIKSEILNNRDVNESQNKESETPVVLVTYNRPEHTKQVIDSLRNHKVQNLFVFSDAPKTDKDKKGVEQTRELIESIDWTTPNITFQDVNQGLARSITSAVDKVFETYDRMIVLEDDCVPQKYFFSFMNECLNKYENNDKIFGICGHTITIPDEILKDYPYDLYFYPRIGSWGWATWKKSWKYKIDDLKFLMSELSKNNIDLNQGGNDVPFSFAKLLDGSLKDVWTLNWLLSVYLKNGVYVYPTESHIKNIGFDGTGLHCGKTNKYDSEIAKNKPTKYPDEVIYNDLIKNTFLSLYNIPGINQGQIKQNSLKKKDQQEPVVLLYHRVDVDPLDSQLLSVTPEHFEEQLILLKKNFNIIPLSRLVKDLKTRKLKQKTLSITFDDGYLDNLTNALPILEKHKIHATIFVTSGMVGVNDEFWWDKLERIFLDTEPLPKELNISGDNNKFYWELTTADGRIKAHSDLHKLLMQFNSVERNKTIEQLYKWANIDSNARETHRLMTIKQLKILAASPYIEIGAHTVNHSRLSSLTENEQEFEILESQKSLENIIRKKVNLFSYPFGTQYDFNQTSMDILSRNDFEAGIANISGNVKVDTNIYMLPRFLVRNWNGEKFLKWINSENKIHFENEEIEKRDLKLKKILDKKEILNNGNIILKENSLNITHLNTVDASGGAAKIARQLTGIQNSLGNSSKLLVGQKQSNSLMSIEFPLICDKLLFNENIEKGYLYYELQGSHKLLNHELIKESDIIHLHNLHGGYFNPFSILFLSKKKPVVWTLHDMQALTGHCAHSLECEKWIEGCSECPALGLYPAVSADATFSLWKDKKFIYENSDFTLTVPSQWLKGKISKSILKNKRCEFIPNGVDTDIFKPGNKRLLRKKYNIPENAFIMGGIAEGGTLSNPWKGGDYTIKAVEKIFNEIPNSFFLNIGAKSQEDNARIINIPSINDDNLLSEIYSLMDVNLVTSIADNAPLVVLEALACGLPVVSFSTGGIPEMIRHGETGFISEYKNVDKITAKVIKLGKDKNLIKKFSENAREDVLKRFDINKITEQYINLYNDSIKNFTPSKSKFSLNEIPDVIKTKHFLDSYNYISADEDSTVNKKQSGIKVSAIVSTYNSEKFIRGCLDNLINQTLYKKDELEIIVVNSGSQQNEDEVVKEYQSKYKNIKYFKTARETIYKAWNRGIKEASGKYITNANTDDRHKENALEILADTLDEENSVVLVYADSKVTDKVNEKFNTANVTGLLLWPEFDRTNLFRICYVGPQPMWRKTLHEKYGYFDGTYKSAGDYDFWLRVSNHEKFKHINKLLGLYLLSENSIEHSNQNTSIIESEKARKNNWESDSNLPPLSGTYLSHYNCSENLPESFKFSVVIPTCDRPESLRKALQSLTKQTFKDFEVVVINDGNQEILNVIKEFNGKLNYQHVRNLMNRERSASRNNGIKVSKGKFITFLDDDDIFFPEHLQVITDNLYNSTQVVYTDAVRAVYKKTNKEYKIIDKSVPYSIDYDRNKLLIGNIAPINCFAVLREKLFEAGLFDETINVLEDWELLLRLSELTTFKHIMKNTCEVSWKLDGSSTTSSKGYLFDKVRRQIYGRYDKEIKIIPNRNEIVEEFNKIWKNDFAYNSSLVSIIALSFNQLKYTKSFVQSVLEFTKISFELILVDNGSNKETVDFLKDLSTKDERIKIIFNEENYGFPKGVNQGIKAAKGDYILIANNDIIVTDGWLERMVEVAEADNQIAIVGPMSNSVSGVQLEREATYPDIEKMYEYAMENKQKNSGQIFQFPRVAFLCTLIKKEVIEKIGGLDERFSPGNFEDDDFCLRTQIAGYKTVIAKDVFIHHFGSKSFTADGTKKYAERLEINKQIFVEKWGADPEEIWLKGKKCLNKNIFYPLEIDKFSETIQRAHVCIQDKEYELALNYLRTVLENKNFNFDKSQTKIDSLFHLAGKICLIERKFEQAINYFQKELENNCESVRAYKGLGDTYLAMGDKEEAQKTYKKVYKQKDLKELTEIN